jgi:spermidine/putrescine transport system permease protein
MVALVLWRFRFPGKTALDGALALPIVVPEICMGVAMLVFFAKVLPWPWACPGR